MRRYLPPAVPFLLAALTFVLMTNLPPTRSEDPGWEIMFGLYGLGTLWWLIVAGRSPAPFWPHVIAAWIPAVLPVILLVDLIFQIAHNELAVVMLYIYAPWAAVTVLVCAGGALTIRINRQEWSRANLNPPRPDAIDA